MVAVKIVDFGIPTVNRSTSRELDPIGIGFPKSSFLIQIISVQRNLILE